MTSLRSCQKLSLCLTELMRASSKTDLLLAEAWPGSDGRSTSGITFEKEKSIIVQKYLQREERELRICERNN